MVERYCAACDVPLMHNQQRSCSTDCPLPSLKDNEGRWQKTNRWHVYDCSGYDCR